MRRAREPDYTFFSKWFYHIKMDGFKEKILKSFDMR